MTLSEMRVTGIEKFAISNLEHIMCAARKAEY
jgi:hypothetical protein